VLLPILLLYVPDGNWSEITYPVRDHRESQRDQSEHENGKDAAYVQNVILGHGVSSDANRNQRLKTQRAQRTFQRLCQQG
jgi:hypothetical protein